MYHCRAINLLDVIGAERRVTTAFSSVAKPDGKQRWLVCAVSDDGEQWRSEHADFLHAVVMLDQLLAESDRRCGAARSLLL